MRNLRFSPELAKPEVEVAVHAEARLVPILRYVGQPGIGSEHVDGMAPEPEPLDDGLAREGVAANAVRRVLICEDQDSHSAGIVDGTLAMIILRR